MRAIRGHNVLVHENTICLCSQWRKAEILEHTRQDSLYIRALNGLNESHPKQFLLPRSAEFTEPAARLGESYIVSCHRSGIGEEEVDSP